MEAMQAQMKQVQEEQAIAKAEMAAAEEVAAAARQAAAAAEAAKLIAEAKAAAEAAQAEEARQAFKAQPPPSPPPKFALFGLEKILGGVASAATGACTNRSVQPSLKGF